VPARIALPKLNFRICPFVQRRVAQRCGHALYCHVAEFTITDTQTSTVRLENLPSESTLMLGSILALKHIIENDVVNGLKQDIEQSQCYYVDTPDWQRTVFLIPLRRSIERLWNLISGPGVAVDTWHSWRILERWIEPESRNLQSLWDEIDTDSVGPRREI
jgi:hypothetical protein